MMKIKKLDTIISLILGFLVAIFLLITLRITGIEIGLTQQGKHIWFLFIGFPTLAFLGIFIASHVGRKFSLTYQIIKFCLVGASSVTIDLGILNFLMWFSGVAAGPLYILFKGFSALASTINGYLWNKHWTFAKNDCFFSVKEFSKFILVIAIGFLIDVSLASFVVIIIGPRFGMSEILWANFGALIALIVVSFWNFAGQKIFVFK